MSDKTSKGYGEHTRARAMLDRIGDLEAAINGLGEKCSGKTKDKLTMRKPSESMNTKLLRHNKELRRENDILWEQVNDLKQMLEDERR